MTNQGKIRFRRGDTVEVRSGRDRGKRGKINQVFARLGMVVVEGINQRVRHLRSQKRNQPGQRLTFNAPLPSSKVILVCPHCDRKTKIAYQQTAAEGSSVKIKTRLCRHCQQTI